MTSNLSSWMQTEFHEHSGFCFHCQRKFKRAYDWAGHVSRQHPSVWKSLADRHSQEAR